MASQQGFAARISAAWRRSIEAVIETGKLLIEAKGKLGHGEFTKMIEKRLPFGAETAQRLMKIARDKRITNPAHGPHLPASWRSLHELTTLSDEEFAAALKDGRIN